MQRECCSLCFASTDDLLTPIEGNARESLIELQHDFVVNIPNNLNGACRNCSTKLAVYLKFKSSLTQTCVQSFGTEQGLLDLNQLYLRNEGNTSEVCTREDLVVCRFCLKQATGAYIPLVENQKEVTLVTILTRGCFPRLELGTMSGHVICVPCREALEASYNFITSLNVENRIKEDDEVDGMEFEDGPDLKSVDDCFTIKREDFDEGVEVKVERGLEQEDEHDLEENKVGIRNHGESRHSDIIVTTKQDVWGEDIMSSFEEEPCDVKTEQDASERTSGLTDYKKHAMRMTYSCKECSYETKNQSCYQKHMFRHKNPLEINIYACTICPYTAKRQKLFNRHMLIHKNPAWVRIYSCTICPYTSTSERLLKGHMLIHKDPSEVTMYKCRSCSYEAKRRSALKFHQLNHKDPSELIMYKCKSCSYETRRKSTLIYHELIHKKSSEVTMYKCELCSHETKRKSSLTRHKLIHMKPSKVTATEYSCQLCSYETKIKKNYRRHTLIHKNPSDVSLYKCQSCTFKTRHKRNLKSHELTHKSSTEVSMYK